MYKKLEIIACSAVMQPAFAYRHWTKERRHNVMEKCAVDIDDAVSL